MGKTVALTDLDVERYIQLDAIWSTLMLLGFEEELLPDIDVHTLDLRVELKEESFGIRDLFNRIAPGDDDDPPAMVSVRAAMLQAKILIALSERVADEVPRLLTWAAERVKTHSRDLDAKAVIGDV